MDCSLAVFYINILFQEANVCSSIKAVVGTCSCAISLGYLDFRWLCLAHIATQNQDELLVSVIRNENSSSYFSRKLFEFGAYVNCLYHFDCSHGALAVICNNFLFQAANFDPII